MIEAIAEITYSQVPQTGSTKRLSNGGVNKMVELIVITPQPNKNVWVSRKQPNMIAIASF